MAYPSTREKRVVWVKGPMSKAISNVPALSGDPAENARVIPWRFDTAVLIVMSPRTIPIDLQAEALVSADPFPVTANMSVTCEPKDSNQALADIAVYYQQSVLSLTKLAGSHLRAALSKLRGEDVAQHQVELGDSFIKMLTTVEDSLIPFRITKVHLNLSCSEVEKLIREKRTAEIQALVDYALAANKRAATKAAQDLKQIESKQALRELREKGVAEVEIFIARIKGLKGFDALDVYTKIAALRDDPNGRESIERMEVAKHSNDLNAYKLAERSAQESLRAVAEASRGGFGGAGPIININKP